MKERTYPTSAMIIDMITRQPRATTQDDMGAEEQTAEDYDAAIYLAWLDLTSKPPRFHALPDDAKTIDDPTDRLLRLGLHSIEERRPSELFQFLLSETKNGTALPRVPTRTKAAAQKRLDIANAFKEHLRKLPKTANFKDAKRKFRVDVARLGIKGIFPSDAAIDDALALHDIEWDSYCIDAPRKGKRSK